MQRTAVVILNWNGAALLEKFLPSVLQFTPSSAEIIIADNASTDNSVALMKKSFPAVTVIPNKSNGGYAKGYNDALKDLTHEYFVLLNSDVEVTQKWLEPLIAMMDQDKNIAACQPKILTYQNKKQFEYAGAAGGFIDKYGFPFCRGRMFDTYENDEGQYDDVKEIFWATGACMMVRASAFREAGELDEDFFAHMEEIDLCWRMKNLGNKIMYCPGSKIYHVGGGTLNKINPRKTFLNFRNNLILLCKNHAPGFFILKMMMRLNLDGVAGIKFLLGGSLKHFWAVIHAHWSFYAVLGKTLRKRKAMKRRIKKYSTAAIYKRSIVHAYYLMGKKKFSSLDKKYFG